MDFFDQEYNYVEILTKIGYIILITNGVWMKKPVRKKISKKGTFHDRLPNNHGEWLELALHMTEKRIKPNSYDKTMDKQAVRIRQEIVEWKKANSK